MAKKRKNKQVPVEFQERFIQEKRNANRTFTGGNFIYLGAFLAMLLMAGSPFIIIPAGIALFGYTVMESAEHYRELINSLYFQVGMTDEEISRLQTLIRMLMVGEVLEYALIATSVVLAFMFPPLIGFVLAGAVGFAVANSFFRSAIETQMRGDEPKAEFATRISFRLSIFLSGVGAFFMVLLAGTGIVIAPVSVFLLGLILAKSIRDFQRKIVDLQDQGYSPEQIDTLRSQMRTATGFKILTLCAVLAVMTVLIVFPPLGVLVLIWGLVVSFAIATCAGVAQWAAEGRLDKTIDKMTPASDMPLASGESKISPVPVAVVESNSERQVSPVASQPQDNFFKRFFSWHRHKEEIVKTQEIEMESPRGIEAKKTDNTSSPTAGKS